MSGVQQRAVPSDELATLSISIAKVEQEIDEAEQEIDETKKEIDETKKEIDETEKEIDETEKRIEVASDPNEKAALRKEEEWLRKEEEWLRKEEEQLRNKKEQLRNKEQQLRNKEFIIMRRQDAAAQAVSGTVVDRKVPELKTSASSVKPDDVKEMWALGNVHNFEAFVCSTGLFANKLPTPLRKLFSPSLVALKKDVDAVYHLAEGAASDAIWRHSSLLTSGRDKFGVFRYRPDTVGSGNLDEQRLSLSVTSALNQFVASLGVSKEIFGAREQYDNAKNSQDYVLNRVLPGGTLQAAIVEFANDTGKSLDNKEAQLFTYIRNDAQSLPASKSSLTLGVAFIKLKSSAPTFQVFGYYQKDGDLFHVVPITIELEMTKTNLANLFYALVAFALNVEVNLLPQRVSDCQDLRYPSGSGGVALLDKTTRVKVINYIPFYPLRIENGGRGSIPEEERRSTEYSLQMLQDANELKLGYGLHMIVFPNIEGTHHPHHSACVVACVEHLADAHNRGILHCDLHLGNFVFNADNPKLSRIIDWDHARPLDHPGCYVPGWQRLVERHPEAWARAPITMEHERYSLGAVLARFKPTECANDKVSSWNQVCAHAQSVAFDLQDLVNELLLMNCKLELADGTLPPIDVTGTPPRETVISQSLKAIPEDEMKKLSIGG